MQRLQWPKSYRSALTQLVQRLGESGLRAEWYTIADSLAFGPLQGNQPTDVHCVEVCLGPSPGAPGYSTYAIAQLPLPAYPNLAFTDLISLQDADRRPSADPARFSIAIDEKFSTLFLPAVFSAFNQLDPTGAQRSLLVQSYSSAMSPSDLLHASRHSYHLLRRFKKDGLLAIIAVDYHDPYSRAIARLIKYVRFLITDVHLIPQTSHPSALRIPVRGLGDTCHLMTGRSSALDEGFAIARDYLNAHYQGHPRATSLHVAGSGSF